jgi:hypothetical protein
MKRKSIKKVVNVTLLNIQTTKPMTFIREIEKVCKKFAVQTKGKKDLDFDFAWDINDGDE